jgi:hypothetical protein
VAVVVTGCHAAEVSQYWARYPAQPGELPMAQSVSTVHAVHLRLYAAVAKLMLCTA